MKNLKRFATILMLTISLKNGIKVVCSEEIPTRIDKNLNVYLGEIRICHLDDIIDVQSDAVNKAWEEAEKRG